MLLWDKKVLHPASLRSLLDLPTSPAADRLLAPFAARPNSAYAAQIQPDFTIPACETLAPWACAHLFTALGLTQPDESRYVQSLA